MISVWLCAKTLVVGLLLYCLIRLCDRPCAFRREHFEALLSCLLPSAALAWIDAEAAANYHKEQDSQRKTAIKYEAMASWLGLRVARTFEKAIKGRDEDTRSANDNSQISGLGNWDNSCYQNSVLQALASLQSLPHFLLQNSGGEENDSSMSQSLYSLAGHLNELKRGRTTRWCPAILKNMSTWQQQDAQEYFSKLIEGIEKECMKKQSQRCRSEGNLHSLSLSPQPDGAVLERSLSIVKGSNNSRSNPMEGLLAQRVGCQNCSYVEGISMVPFNCLTIPLGKSASCSLAECLDQVSALESIPEVECNKCTLLAHHEQSLMSQARQVPSEKGVVKSGSEVPDQDLITTLEQRLANLKQAIENNEFGEDSLKRCRIGKKRVSSTKSRQVLIARAPQTLVLHVNRSQFNEVTGAQSKNYSAVEFQTRICLEPWCIAQPDSTSTEKWSVDPLKSMRRASGPSVAQEQYSLPYTLRAIVTHHGRHENGHYVCYRRRVVPKEGTCPKGEIESAAQKDESSIWWRCSDESISMVSEEFVLRQGEVFMLFYEREECTDLRQTGHSADKIGSCNGATSAAADSSTYESKDSTLLVSPQSGHDSSKTLNELHTPCQILTPECNNTPSIPATSYQTPRKSTSRHGTDPISEASKPSIDDTLPVSRASPVGSSPSSKLAKLKSSTPIEPPPQLQSVTTSAASKKVLPESDTAEIKSSPGPLAPSTVSPRSGRARVINSDRAIRSMAGVVHAN